MQMHANTLHKIHKAELFMHMSFDISACILTWIDILSFWFSGIIFKWKAKNENIKSGTVKKRAMVKKGSAHNWSQIFSSSKQIYLSNFSVSNFIVVQRDDSQFGNSYENTEKKIWRQKRNIINIYKLFVLPGGNGWLIWSTPFYRKYI